MCTGTPGHNPDRAPYYVKEHVLISKFVLWVTLKWRPNKAPKASQTVLALEEMLISMFRSPRVMTFRFDGKTLSLSKLSVIIRPSC